MKYDNGFPVGVDQRPAAELVARLEAELREAKREPVFWSVVAKGLGARIFFAERALQQIALNHAESARHGVMRAVHALNGAFEDGASEDRVEALPQGAIADLTRQRDELSEQLEFDRSAVAVCLGDARRAIASRSWLMEGRGCYEWNDDNWHKEFSAAAEEMLAALSPMEKIGANWKGCPKSAEGIATARIDLKARAAAAEKERDEAVQSFRTAIELEGPQKYATLLDERDALAGKLEAAERQNAAMREALGQAIAAMESAWYELKPGERCMGDQFIRQSDMRFVINHSGNNIVD